MPEQLSDTQQQVLAASSNILQSVYAPMFLQKLAERGYPVETEKEAEELLGLGFKLAEMGVEPSAPTSKYASAVGALDNLNQRTPQASEYTYKQAAAQLAQDPSIYLSALLLQASE